MNAEVRTTIDAPASRVWEALTDPKQVHRYMLGATVKSNYTVGSPITWSGQVRGKAYEDRGKILACEKERVLAYSHESGWHPGCVHNIRIELSERDGKTTLRLVQDNNSCEEAKRASEKNWSLLLKSMKQLLRWR